MWAKGGESEGGIGGGKHETKGKGKDNSGEGRPFDGYCKQCGKWGHKKSEC